MYTVHYLNSIHRSISKLLKDWFLKYYCQWLEVSLHNKIRTWIANTFKCRLLTWAFWMCTVHIQKAETSEAPVRNLFSFSSWIQGSLQLKRTFFSPYNNYIWLKNNNGEIIWNFRSQCWIRFRSSLKFHHLWITLYCIQQNPCTLL